MSTNVVPNHADLPRTGMTKADDAPCSHEPDFATAGVACWEDDGCDVGVTCRKCGEDGFLFLTATGIRWNDEE
jgi:hypothetical protein